MSGKITPPKERMTQLLSSLNEGLIERDETMAIVLLAALSGQNIFLYGPPGTAKSLIARRVSKVFKSKKYFECLMQKFTTPEEIFGPFSIKQLQDGKYERLVEGYLPEADIAFLDEIWKSSPAILNNLLTIINEKKFRNGVEVKNVPLKFLVSASNEIPPENLGLEALYDRFLVRLVVNRIESWDNFERMLKQPSTSEDIAIDESLRITDEEYSKWATEIEKIAVSSDSLNVIKAIKAAIAKYNKNKSDGEIVYISDRRWQRAVHLMKASAFFCDRKETNVADCLLLSHCLWAKIETRSEVVKYVEDAVKGAMKMNHSGSFSSKILELENKSKELESLIDSNLYYQSDVYRDMVSIGKGKHKVDCVRVKFSYGNKPNQRSKVVYVPLDSLMSNFQRPIYTLDRYGKQDGSFNATMINLENKSCRIRSTYLNVRFLFTPIIEHHKGEVIKDKVLKNGLLAKHNALVREYDGVTDELDKKESNIKLELQSPFLSERYQRLCADDFPQWRKDVSKGKENCILLKKKITA